MPYSQIEQRYMDMIVEGYFPTTPTEPARLPEVVVTGEPEPPTSEGGPAGMPEPRFGRGGVTKAQSEAAGGLEVPAMALADTLAGALRGTVAQSLGLPGDIESLVRLLTGGEQVLPTTERVSEMLPPVVPPGAPNAEERSKTADIAGKLGEYNPILGAPEAVKIGVKGGKAAGEALAPAAANVMEQYLTKTGAILKAAPDSPGIEVKSAPKLNTPAFKNWFGNSKVIDEKGKPLVVYHGTQRIKNGIDSFNSKVGFAGQKTAGVHWFTSNPDTASDYANWVRGAENAAVYPMYLSVKKPANLRDYQKAAIDVRADSDPEIGLYDPLVVERLKSQGFDGVSWTNKEYTETSGYAGDNDLTVVVFAPEQIKSIFNKGTFDPKDPRILYGGGAAGVATAGEEKK